MPISVIIPTRNRYDYIKLLIEDLMNQSVLPLEIIVIDQSDNYNKLEDCVQIRTDSRGPCISRNIGTEKANGDILVFLDDDARVNNDFLSEITLPIIEGRFSVVAGAICDVEGKYRTDRQEFLKTPSYNFIKVFTSNPENEVSRITLAFPAGCSAMKKDVFKTVGGFDVSFDPTGAGEDREMAIKLYKFGFAIWYNAKAKLLHATAKTGGSRDLGSRSLMLDFHTYIICKRYFSQELSLELKNSIENAYKRNFYQSLKKLKLVRSKYRAYLDIKRLLNN